MGEKRDVFSNHLGKEGYTYEEAENNALRRKMHLVVKIVNIQDLK